MSSLDYTHFIDKSVVPPLTKALCRMSLEQYPPFLERLLGVWGPLSREPFKGITSDGTPVEGLSSLTANGAPVEQAARAADAWLASLAPSERARAALPLASDAWRQWQNTPLILSDALELEELGESQRQLALQVVAASLSPRGYERARVIMANNQFMGELVQMTDVLNEWRFALSIFGQPSTSEPWGWQLFGHHLAINCFFIGGQMVLSPVFMGMEPDDHDDQGQRRRLFEPHESRALSLLHSLSGPERARATLYESMLTADQPAQRFHPDDGRVRGGAFQDNRIVPYEGVPVAALGRKQRLHLLELASLFIDNLPTGPAAARMQDIERHLNDTWFAWIGKHDDASPFYFRIHGPVAMIEFDHHSGIFLANKEPERFHVHSIVRTPNGGDYGADLLGMHYARTHPHGPQPHSHDGGKTFHRHGDEEGK